MGFSKGGEIAWTLSVCLHFCALSYSDVLAQLGVLGTYRTDALADGKTSDVNVSVFVSCGGASAAISEITSDVNC